MCGSMITDSDYPDDDFQWHAKHCTSSTVLDSDPPYCLCEKGTAGPTQLYLDSIDEMEVATYDFSCAYIDSALVDYDLALLICMLLRPCSSCFSDSAILNPATERLPSSRRPRPRLRLRLRSIGGEVEGGGNDAVGRSASDHRNLDSVLADTRKQLEDFERSGKRAAEEVFGRQSAGYRHVSHVSRLSSSSTTRGCACAL